MSTNHSFKKLEAPVEILPGLSALSRQRLVSPRSVILPALSHLLQLLKQVVTGGRLHHGSGGQIGRVARLGHRGRRPAQRLLSGQVGQVGGHGAGRRRAGRRVLRMMISLSPGGHLHLASDIGPVGAGRRLLLDLKRSLGGGRSRHGRRRWVTGSTAAAQRIPDRRTYR